MPIYHAIRHEPRTGEIKIGVRQYGRERGVEWSSEMEHSLEIAVTIVNSSYIARGERRRSGRWVM